MAVIKNNNTGKWEVRTYYKDIFTGERKQKTKRGFNKKSEAKAWEEAFKLQRDENLDMPMEAFVEIYLADISPKLKENSLMTAIGNPLMMVQFRKQLFEILNELERIQSQDEMSEELFTPIRTMLEILEGFNNSNQGEM